VDLPGTPLFPASPLVPPFDESGRQSRTTKVVLRACSVPFPSVMERFFEFGCVRHLVWSPPPLSTPFFFHVCQPDPKPSWVDCANRHSEDLGFSYLCLFGDGADGDPVGWTSAGFAAVALSPPSCVLDCASL